MIKNLLQKRCSKCGEVKWIIYFAPRKTSKDGFYKQCRNCKNEQQTEWRRELYKRDRTSEYKKKYGITQKDYDELFNKQNGHCAICGRHQIEFNQRLCIDHRHSDGKIRGLLCIACNYYVGVVENNNFEKVYKYLGGK